MVGCFVLNLLASAVYSDAVKPCALKRQQALEMNPDIGGNIGPPRDSLTRFKSEKIIITEWQREVNYHHCLLLIMIII